MTNIKLSLLIKNLLKENNENHMDLEAVNNPLGGALDSQASLQLDWNTDLSDFEDQCKKHGLTGEVIQLHGPGGGNPEVEIMGPKAKIVAFLNDGVVEDEEDLEFFVSLIQEEGIN